MGYASIKLDRQSRLWGPELVYCLSAVDFNSISRSANVQTMSAGISTVGHEWVLIDSVCTATNSKERAHLNWRFKFCGVRRLLSAVKGKVAPRTSHSVSRYVWNWNIKLSIPFDIVSAPCFTLDWSGSEIRGKWGIGGCVVSDTNFLLKLKSI